MLAGAITWERRDPDSDVLIVTNIWPSEDRPVYGIFVKRQVDSLVRAGVRCDVLYVRGYRSPIVYLQAALWFALSSLRLRGRYRLVHAHAGETALAVRCHLGTPLLVSYLGDDVLGNPGAHRRLTYSSRLRALIIRQHSHLVSATITKSEEMERALPSIPRKRNVVVPNGVDTTVFRPLPREQSRTKLGWDGEELVALFAATKPEIPRKRLWLAQAACAYAQEALGRPIRLEVAGSVMPHEMPLLMGASDCLLMTSSLEGSPNTVKEALMCNLPVVATPAGDIELLLEGVEPSYLRPPRADELGEALVECLSARRRSNGRRVAAWLSDEAIAARLVDLYRELAHVELAQSAAPTLPTEPARSD